MSDLECDLLVIGGGPGGYVCAIRAGQLGLDTVLVEEAALGGTCLNVGCIPSKALIHVADRYHDMARAAEGADEVGLSCASPALDLARTVAWKDGIVGRLTGGVGALLKRAGVTVIEGRAALVDGKTAEVDGRRIRCRTMVLATGSERVELPGLPMGGRVIGSREALDLTEVPERLAVIGAGYIGLELGTAFAKMGARVTVLEAGDRALPLYDAALVKPVVDRLPALGVDLRLGVRAEALEGDRLRLSEGEPVAADLVLVAAGRRPRTEALTPLELAMDGPFVRIGARCETSMRGVYAVGDVTGEPLLAHRAMAQGEMVAEIAAGRPRRWDKVVPAVCFTDPEIVAVGAGPDAPDTLVGQFPFRANGRTMTLEREDGFVRVVARAADHAVVGVQAVGVGVAEMGSAFATAIEMGARLEDVGAIVQAHPTQSEGLQEAALKALGHAIHA